MMLLINTCALVLIWVSWLCDGLMIGNLTAKLVDGGQAIHIPTQHHLKYYAPTNV